MTCRRVDSRLPWRSSRIATFDVQRSLPVLEILREERRDRAGSRVAMRGNVIVILWTLAGFVDVIHCELAEAPIGCALGLRVGHEQILSYLWPDAEQAHARARELRARLLARGWLERT